MCLMCVGEWRSMDDNECCSDVGSVGSVGGVNAKSVDTKSVKPEKSLVTSSGGDS